MPVTHIDNPKIASDDSPATGKAGSAKDHNAASSAIARKARLFEFAKVLDVPVSHFFEEMPAAETVPLRARRARPRERRLVARRVS